MCNRSVAKSANAVRWTIIAALSIGCGGSGCVDRCGGAGAEDPGVATGDADPGGVDSVGMWWLDATEEPDDRRGHDKGNREVERDCGLIPKYDPCAEDLPAPGSPCDREGEIRCTNEGASTWGYPDHPICFYPNYVRCEEGQQAALEWVIHEVPMEHRGLDFGPATCQENARGVQFCPRSWEVRLLIGEYDQVLCDPKVYGLRYCSRFLEACVFADEVTDEYYSEFFIKPSLERCPTCVNCLYHWPVERCPDWNRICWPEEHQAGTWGRPGKCIVDDECRVRCAENWYDFCVR